MRSPESCSDALDADNASASAAARRTRSSLLTAAPGLAAAVAVVTMLCATAAAAADEFPKRKAGLWEMKTTGGPVGARTVQQCIDAATDDLLRTRSNEGQNCTRPVIERDGGRYKVRSSCENNGVKSTVDGEYTMSGDTSYTGDMKMSFDPPMSGVSEMNMKMEGKWVGACKAGMKPGDMVMQGMPRLNVLEMGKP